jgi:hypothetical protein
MSHWDTKENLEAYIRDVAHRVLKAIGRIIEGTPVVKTYDVTLSRLHKIRAAASV